MFCTSRVSQPAIAMPTMLMSRVAALPHISCQAPTASATAMFPDAGIVVTEMNTPTSPLPLADVIARTPADPAITAMMKDH